MPSKRFRLVGALFGALLLPVVVFVAAIRRASVDRRTLIWGPAPILNNKYWSSAVRRLGFRSMTHMETYYERINERTDFDAYFDDLIPTWLRPRRLRQLMAPYFALAYWLTHASVVHIPYSGGPLGRTAFWRLEAILFRWFRVRVVVLAYGSDFYRYSRVDDLSLRHALLMSYPDAGRRESAIAKHVDYWERRGDVVIPGLCVEGAARWDVLTPQAVCIDEQAWSARDVYSSHDGRNGPVIVVHAPNHRGFKGSEFVIHAVEKLRGEGLDVRLLLLEGVPNTEVRERLLSADILVEQLIATGYALSGEEGMATGLPVIANLAREERTRVFRRYSFLDECPVLSATPENAAEALRLLVTSPELRRELGQAGRQYVVRYHSQEAAGRLFAAIYRYLLEGKDVDLLTLFHPLMRSPDFAPIQHPLVENRWPGTTPDHSSR